MNEILIKSIKESGFSVNDVAILGDISRSKLSDFAMGTDIPNRDYAKRLEQLLGKPIEVLFPDYKDYYAEK